MFIGHYAVALAAKRWAPSTSLGATFLAVQFLDILWAAAILLGIEKARVVPGFLAASPLNLYSMPWTHSLFMAGVWAWLIYRISKIPALGVCVFSHWVLDFLVHGPDLLLMPRGELRVGLGLWRFREGTFALESLLVIAGWLVYMYCTRERNPAGRYASGIFVAFLIAVEAGNLYGPPPPTIQMVAVSGLVAYFSFAGIALWVDRYRDHS